MSKHDDFKNVKQAMIDKNEAAYGKEIRQTFGDAAIDASNAKVKGMSQSQWQEAESLRRRINEALRQALASGDPTGEAAQQACDLHRQWLCLFWKDGTYSKAAHLALAEGYVADARFTAYYDAIAPGCTKFLRDAIKVYCGK